jgi:SRSO17 transposase
MTSRFLALRVRPANRCIPRAPDATLPECRLIAEWPPGTPEPTDYWPSTLPVDTPLRELVRLAKIRWRIEHDYRELKDGLGMDHFEGRSHRGWHRHVTLTALAQAFCTSLRHDPKAPAPARPSTPSSANSRPSSASGPAPATPASDPTQTRPNKALLARRQVGDTRERLEG